MARKKKLINNLDRVISENETSIHAGELLVNPQIILNEVFLHIEKSKCKNCDWQIHLFDPYNQNLAKDFLNRECLFKINFDQQFLKAEIANELIQNHNLIVHGSTSGFGMSSIIIFCQVNNNQ